MNRGYLTKSRAAYYVAIGLAALAVNALVKSSFGEKETMVAMVLLMWLMLVVDTKIAPPSISLSRSFLPGIGWIDLAIALLVYAGLAWIGYQSGPTANNSEFVIVFLCAMAVCFAAGILALLSWRRWRGLR